MQHDTHDKERNTLNIIKDKLQTNEALISKDDKGNTIVIIYQDDYHEKITDFIKNNNLTTVNNEPTKSFQRKIRNIINECQIVIPKDEKWKYVNLNTSAPTIRGLLKIHEIDSPIRPVVNWKNAPAFKLAKLFAKNLQTYLPLPYAFNVKNSVQLIDDLLKIPFDPNLQFISFDIMNMYSNVQTEDLTNIIDFMCSQHYVDNNLKHKLININPTYFQFLNTLYLQEKVLAMGSPTSSVFS